MNIQEETGLKWLVLDLNSFFASCEQQDNPDLRGKPLIVVPLLADTTCAIAASYEAKALGIHTGTLVSEAKKLCPKVRLVQADHRRYLAYHHKILEAIEECLPIEDVMSIDEVACLLDKTQRGFAEAKNLALQLKKNIQEKAGECLTSSIGIAPNRLLAKLASDMQKPDGLVRLARKDFPQAILHLPPEALSGIGENMRLRLLQAGIATMEDLWKADASYLRRVWNGVNGARFHALLHGEDLPSPVRPTRSMGHQHVLAPEDRTIEKALLITRQLLIKASQRLRDEAFFAQRLILCVKWQGGLGYFVQDQRFTERQETSFFLSLLDRLWEKAPNLHPLRVGITLADLVPASSHQPDLFEKRKSQSLIQAIDLLNRRFGTNTVRFGENGAFIRGKISFSRVPEAWEV